MCVWGGGGGGGECGRTLRTSLPYGPVIAIAGCPPGDGKKRDSENEIDFPLEACAILNIKW